MYSLPRMAIANYHSLGAYTTDIDHLMLLEAGSPKLRCQQGWFLLRGVQDNLSQASRVASGGLGLRDGVLTGSLHHFPSMCV